MKTPGRCDCCGDVSVRKLFWHFLCPRCAKDEIEEIKHWSCERCGHTNEGMPLVPDLSHKPAGAPRGGPFPH